MSLFFCSSLAPRHSDLVDDPCFDQGPVFAGAHLMSVYLCSICSPLTHFSLSFQSINREGRDGKMGARRTREGRERDMRETREQARETREQARECNGSARKKLL